MITAIKIEKILQIGAAHALYRKDGKWYHHLKDFPGMLFDINGYVVFSSKTDYISSSYLQHGEDSHVSGGIKKIPGYREFTEEEKRKILNLA